MTAASPAGPSEAGIARVLSLKYGDPPTGWGPLLRRRYGYRTPDDLYEATVAELVTPGCSWADIGCGHELFPSNKPLARELAGRAGLLVGVDPDETLEENPYVHRKVRALLTDFRPEAPFDLVTLRMVAEHIPDPEAAAAALARMVRPGGTALIYTVNLWAPVSLAAKCMPFGLQHPIKKLLWRTAISIESRRTSLPENLSVMLASAAPWFGRDSEMPVFVDDAARRKAEVHIGTPVVVPDPPNEAPSLKK